MEGNPMKARLNKRIKSVFLLSLLVLSSQLLAFDGQRKGFILGGGIGAGSISYEETAPEWKLNRFALTGNFKIGYAPTNSLELYYIADVSEFAYSQSESLVAGGTCIGFSGVGLTKYLSPRGTGLFLSGGVGIPLLTFLNTRSGVGDVTGGFGLLGGIGHDVSRHWRLQGDVVYISMRAVHTKSLGVRVTFNFLAF
jgi:hypothetical protein